MKNIVLMLFIVLAVVALDIPVCGNPLVPTLKFSLWNGTADPTASTSASICHDSNNLVISWDCIDSDIIAPYQKCNDPLYNADAV